MRPLVGPVPEPAERALSALRRSPRASLRTGDSDRPVPLVHAVPGTAEVMVAVPTGGDAGPVGGTLEDGAEARLEVLDVVLGGAADGRCRRVVVVEGRITIPDAPAQRRAASDLARDLPDPALLDVGTASVLVRLHPERIVLTDHDGVTLVDPDDLATSGPDPFADLEGLWLAHLGDPWCRVVERLAARLVRCLPAERPLLVGIDRAGVDLEVAGPDGAVRRHRLPFAEACVGVAELGTQIRLLAGCPRSAAPLRGRDGGGAGQRAQNPASTGRVTPEM